LANLQSKTVGGKDDRVKKEGGKRGAEVVEKRVNTKINSTRRG